jgi:hypothetical protein
MHDERYAALHKVAQRVEMQGANSGPESCCMDLPRFGGEVKIFVQGI